jgi:hypothetical protein
MNRLPLAQVTLCAIDCRTPALALSALLAARRRVAFGRVMLLTHDWLPTMVLPGLEVIDVGPLDTPADVADFVARRLHTLVSSSHVLLTQWDCGVMQPESWTDEFLVHDYVAAADDRRPGTLLPGLSLRSRRFLRAGNDPRFAETPLDDDTLCHLRRTFLQDVHGVSFAPEALCQRFVAQGQRAESWQFGFAGPAFLPALHEEAEMLEVVRRLPREFLAHRGFDELHLALCAQGMNEAAAALGMRRAAEQSRQAALRAAGPTALAS